MTSQYLDQERSKAEVWDNVDRLREVETGRLPVEGALRKVISDVFEQYVASNGVILETGAGLGYLKTIVPSKYHPGYLSSDYNSTNLRFARNVMGRKNLQGASISAYDLALKENSVDCVINLDAYDTLPNLARAMREVKRVLKTGGVFIHLQVSMPSADTVEEEYPGLIWFPARRIPGERINITGVKPQDLERGVDSLAAVEQKNLFKQFLSNPKGAYDTLEHSLKALEYIDMVHRLINQMPVDKLVLPSLSDYFKEKLGRMSQQAGLAISESEYREVKTQGYKTEEQKQRYPQYNQFSLRKGILLFGKQQDLPSGQVEENLTSLVFVAKK